MRIDFYLLNDTHPEAVWLSACRLLEKAYLRNHNIFVYCSNQRDAEHLDELLWTFKPNSFIPHHLQGEGPEPPPPIQIGYAEEPRGFTDILMNLSDSVPAFVSRFQRIIEIVSTDDSAKTISREHFRHYRSMGITPGTHNLPNMNTQTDTCP